jgi:hypothetical protein
MPDEEKTIEELEEILRAFAEELEDEDEDATDYWPREEVNQ